MRDSFLIKLIAGSVCAAAWTIAVFDLQGSFGPGLNRKPHEAAGWKMAQQAMGLLRPGGRLVVITRDSSSFKNPASEVQLASFKKTLAKAHVTLDTVQVLAVDPLRPVRVPTGDLLELLHQIPKGSVVVSFLGPPLLDQGPLVQLGEIKAGLVAFCSGALAETLDFRRLFEEGLLNAAVVTRHDAPPGRSRPRDLQAWFDQNFWAVDSANAAAFSPRAAAPP